MPAPATKRTPFSQTRGGLSLAVRVQPGAGRTAIGGLVTRADGGVALRASVTAAPEAGKANAALIALLAKTWRLPKGAFEITRGRGDRDKTLLIAGEPAPLKERLEAWLRDSARDHRR